MDKTGQSAIVGLIAVVLIGIVVVGFLALSRVDQYLKNRAMAECSELATYTEEITSTGGNGEQIVKTSKQPIKDIYKICVEDKGYQTSITP